MLSAGAVLLAACSSSLTAAGRRPRPRLLRPRLLPLPSRAASLTGDNLPLEIGKLTLVGNYPGGVFAAGPDAGPDAGQRTNQQPLMASLVSFPSLP